MLCLTYAIMYKIHTSVVLNNSLHSLLKTYLVAKDAGDLWSYWRNSADGFYKHRVATGLQFIKTQSKVNLT